MSENKLASPLQNLLERAKSLPKSGEVAKFQKRLDEASNEVVILADVSSSMAEHAGAKTKEELLHDALRQVTAQFTHLRLVAFSSTAQEVPDVAHMPLPSGGTALHLALFEAARFKPGQTVVISDGQPDSEQMALDAAATLTGTIDVIYCGPDSDSKAIEFMQRLARANGGRCVITNALELAPVMRRVLYLPEPEGGQ